MRIYLESYEQGEIGTDLERVSLDVTDKTQAERDAILVSLKDFMNMNGSTNVFRLHDCYHDEGKSCTAGEV